MFSWLRDFRGARRIMALEARIDDLLGKLEAESACSDEFSHCLSETAGERDGLRALLVEKVFPALEELERRGVCDRRLRLRIAAEVDDLAVRPGDADFDVYEWF